MHVLSYMSSISSEFLGHLSLSVELLASSQKLLVQIWYVVFVNCKCINPTLGGLNLRAKL